MRIKTVLTKATEYACTSQAAPFSSPSLPQEQGGQAFSWSKLSWLSDTGFSEWYFIQ